MTGREKKREAAGVPDDLLLRAVEVRPGFVADVRVCRGVIAEVGPALAAAGGRVIDGGGGALLPGLHDHHCHVLATSAAASSVLCGPPAVRTPRELAAALQGAAAGGGWVRGVGYDEMTAGLLDRRALDDLVADVPVRIQHRSGALWMLNSAAVEALGVDQARLDGIERDAAGHPTGRLWRLDGWLRERLGVQPPPDLAAVGRMLAAYGITGVTDATADMAGPSLTMLAEAHRSGTLPQRLLVLGADSGARLPSGMAAGPRKIVVPDHDLPGFDRLASSVRAARGGGRAVALHCVTRESLLLSLAVLAEVGIRPGDRIEHAAVAPPEAVEAMARSGLTVVTQPSLLARRGDDYLSRVDADDVPFLWRYRSFLTAGIPAACSSDAPYGDLDPWASIAAAVHRTTPSGTVIGPDERVTASEALSGYLSHPQAPGGAARALSPGAPADFVLLREPRDAVLADPVSNQVRLTAIAGAIVHEAG